MKINKIGEGIRMLRRISDRGFDIAQDFCNQVFLVTGYEEG